MLFFLVMRTQDLLTNLVVFITEIHLQKFGSPHKSVQIQRTTFSRIHSLSSFEKKFNFFNFVKKTPMIFI